MTRSLIPALALLAIFAPAGLPAHAAMTMPAAGFPMALGQTMPAPAFRHVAMNGTTKPAGAALDERGGLTPALRAREREIHRLVATAICRGC